MVRLTIFLSSLCSVSVSISDSSSVFSLSQGGSTEANVTPVQMLLRGNWLLSLSAVGSHMLMFSYSKEMRRGSHKDYWSQNYNPGYQWWGEEEAPSVTPQALNPSVLESTIGFWSTTLTLPFHQKLDFFFVQIAPLAGDLVLFMASVAACVASLSYQTFTAEAEAQFSCSADCGFRRHHCVPLHGPCGYRQRFQLIYISCFYLHSAFN